VQRSVPMPPVAEMDFGDRLAAEVTYTFDEQSDVDRVTGSSRWRARKGTFEQPTPLSWGHTPAWGRKQDLFSRASLKSRTSSQESGGPACVSSNSKGTMPLM
jgi:hypothetical protein